MTVRRLAALIGVASVTVSGCPAWAESTAPEVIYISCVRQSVTKTDASGTVITPAKDGERVQYRIDGEWGVVREVGDPHRLYKIDVLNDTDISAQFVSESGAVRSLKLNRVTGELVEALSPARSDRGWLLWVKFQCEATKPSI